LLNFKFELAREFVRDDYSASGRRALALKGWTPPPDDQGPPPGSYETPPRNM